HSQLPARVGPIRSVRPMDAPLLGPLNPVFGNTMGARWVMAYVDRVAHLDDLGTLRVKARSGAYVLDSRRVAPNHVFAQPAELMALSRLRKPPAPYFTVAKEAVAASTAGGSAARSADIPYGPKWDVKWAYDAGKAIYLRSQPWGRHVMADGRQIFATNVLVLRVGSDLGKIGTASGAPVPILDLIDGSGSLVLLSQGRQVKGTWTKAGVNDPFVLTAKGKPLLLAPGNTWVEMPTPDAKVILR
ncbi:MAG TPA: DUF3048 C-terminal domain-containing protein, partial [Candidatus Lustribacter sp.]|nr:DUF3048 C-terminal domain-containing protein [Candidatus Lustribacter sp.]